MNVLCQKILNSIACTLIGLNIGFCVAVLMVQWTWLELRFNAGLFILVGLFLGLIYGLLIRLRHSWAWGGFSVAVLLLLSLVIGGGTENMKILLGSVFREGILMPSLSLQWANYMFEGIALLTVITSWGLGWLQGRVRDNTH